MFSPVEVEISVTKPWLIDSDSIQRLTYKMFLLVHKFMPQLCDAMSFDSSQYSNVHVQRTLLLRILKKRAIHCDAKLSAVPPQVVFL